MSRHILISATIFLAATLVPDQPNVSAQALGQVRVQIVSLRKPVMAAEIPGRIAKTDMRPGSFFMAGDILVSFDCDLHRTREARARAQRDKVKLQSDALTQLDKRGAASALEVNLIATDLTAAQAELHAAELTVQRCDVRAPFSGRVVELRTQAGEYVAEGQPIIEIIDESELEVEALLPSSQLAGLHAGSTIQIHLEELRITAAARITRVAPLIDPISQTAKVYAQLVQRDPKILAGMSGTAQFATTLGSVK